jgi:hypothetical protein
VADATSAHRKARTGKRAFGRDLTRVLRVGACIGDAYALPGNALSDDWFRGKANCPKADKASAAGTN